MDELEKVERLRKKADVSYEEAKQALEECGCTSSLNKVEMNGGKTGVITASIAYQYAKDVFPADTSFLKLGLTNPLPMKLIREFDAKVERSTAFRIPQKAQEYPSYHFHTG